MVELCGYLSLNNIWLHQGSKKFNFDIYPNILQIKNEYGIPEGGFTPGPLPVPLQYILYIRKVLFLSERALSETVIKYMGTQMFFI
jgi:hypothetical protein